MATRDTFERFDGRRELKANWLNRIADAVTKLLRIQVAPPLELRDLGAGGLLISIADEAAGFMARLTAEGEGEQRGTYSWVRLKTNGEDTDPPVTGVLNAEQAFGEWGIVPNAVVRLQRLEVPHDGVKFWFEYPNEFWAKVTSRDEAPLYGFTTADLPNLVPPSIVAQATEVNDVTFVQVGAKIHVWFGNGAYWFEYAEPPSFWGRVTAGAGPTYTVEDVDAESYEGVAEVNGVLGIAVGTWVRVFPTDDGYAFEYQKKAPEPSDTVEAETTWGKAPDVGTADTYSRGDHTHGTPAEPDVGPTYTDGLGIVFSGVSLDVIDVDLAQDPGLQFIGAGNDELAVKPNNAEAVHVDADGVGITIGNGFEFVDESLCPKLTADSPIRVDNAGIDLNTEGGHVTDLSGGAWIIINDDNEVAHNLPGETYLDTEADLP